MMSTHLLVVAGISIFGLAQAQTGYTCPEDDGQSFSFEGKIYQIVCSASTTTNAEEPVKADSSWRQCIAACTGSPECTAFTYQGSPNGEGPGICHFKTDTGIYAVESQSNKFVSVIENDSYSGIESNSDAAVPPVKTSYKCPDDDLMTMTDLDGVDYTIFCSASPNTYYYTFVTATESFNDCFYSCSSASPPAGSGETEVDYCTAFWYIGGTDGLGSGDCYLFKLDPVGVTPEPDRDEFVVALRAGAPEQTTTSTTSSSTSSTTSSTSSTSETATATPIATCPDDDKQTVTIGQKSFYIACSSSTTSSWFTAPGAVSSWNECLTMCESYGSCIGFTYKGSPFGQGPGTCYLKESSPIEFVTTSRNDFISALLSDETINFATNRNLADPSVRSSFECPNIELQTVQDVDGVLYVIDCSAYLDGFNYGYVAAAEDFNDCFYTCSANLPTEPGGIAAGCTSFYYSGGGNGVGPGTCYFESNYPAVPIDYTNQFVAARRIEPPVETTTTTTTTTSTTSTTSSSTSSTTTATATAPPTCPDDNESVVTVNGKPFVIGCSASTNIFREIEVPASDSWNYCLESCAQSGSCVGFTYQGAVDGKGAGTCYIKTGDTYINFVPSYREGFVSAILTSALNPDTVDPDTAEPPVRSRARCPGGNGTRVEDLDGVAYDLFCSSILYENMYAIEKAAENFNDCFDYCTNSRTTPDDLSAGQVDYCTGFWYNGSPDGAGPGSCFLMNYDSMEPLSDSNTGLLVAIRAPIASTTTSTTSESSTSSKTSTSTSNTSSSSSSTTSESSTTSSTDTLSTSSESSTSILSTATSSTSSGSSTLTSTGTSSTSSDSSTSILSADTSSTSSESLTLTSIDTSSTSSERSASILSADTSSTSSDSLTSTFSSVRSESSTSSTSSSRSSVTTGSESSSISSVSSIVSSSVSGTPSSSIDSGSSGTDSVSTSSSQYISNSTLTDSSTVSSNSSESESTHSSFSVGTTLSASESNSISLTISSTVPSSTTASNSASGSVPSSSSPSPSSSPSAGASSVVGSTTGLSTSDGGALSSSDSASLSSNTLSSSETVSSPSSSPSTCSANTEQLCPACDNEIYVTENRANYDISCDNSFVGTRLNPDEPSPSKKKRQDEVLTYTLESCLDICDRYAACVGVNVNTTSCELYSSLTGSGASPGTIAALKRSGPTRNVVVTVITSICSASRTVTIFTGGTTTTCPADASCTSSVGMNRKRVEVE